jgi:hypothetical protein
VENKTIPETKDGIKTLLEATVVPEAIEANEKAPTTSLPEAGDDPETVLKEKAVPKGKEDTKTIPKAKVGPEAILKVKKVSETREDIITVPNTKKDSEIVLKEKAVSETKKDVKTVLVPVALEDPETVLKESSASETKKDTETTSKANDRTYTEPDDDVTTATKEDNSSQSGGSLPWGVILFGGDEHLDAESQSSGSSCASDGSDDTRESWDEESEISGPGSATIVDESLPNGVREIAQEAYEDEHESLASEVKSEKCSEQKEGAMCSLPAVLKQQSSKQQETGRSIRKGEVTNCIQDNPKVSPESTQDRVPRALEQKVKVQNPKVQKQQGKKRMFKRLKSMFRKEEKGAARIVSDSRKDLDPTPDNSHGLFVKDGNTPDYIKTVIEGAPIVQMSPNSENKELPASDSSIPTTDAVERSVNGSYFTNFLPDGYEIVTRSLRFRAKQASYMNHSRMG